MTDDDGGTHSMDGPDWPRLARAIAEGGAVDPAEQVPAGPHAMRRVALVRALSDALRPADPPAPTAVETERALAQVRARRGAATGAVARRLPRLAVLAAAAAVLLVAGGLQRQASRRAPALAPEAFTTLAQTRVGQVDSLRLPDGSLAILGPGSRLEAAGPGSRTVVLNGEAYFDVVHVDARPFTVRTPDALLRDVGTRFVVRTGGAGGSMVAVRSGAVAVRALAGAGTERQLAAGDRATLRGTEVRVERGVASDADAAWTQGRLALRDAPLDEVADALRRWYGIELRVRDSSLRDRRVTASFGKERGQDAVRVVAAVVGAGVRFAGDTATLTATVP